MKVFASTIVIFRDYFIFSFVFSFKYLLQSFMMSLMVKVFLFDIKKINKLWTLSRKYANCYTFKEYLPNIYNEI